jgi:hypothetical protein
MRVAGWKTGRAPSWALDQAEDIARLKEWPTNGTANYPTLDGVHPTTPLHILGGQVETAIANTFAP